MGIYGIDFFGTDFYGPNPQFLPSTYSVAPFSAEAMGYTTFLLSWNKPTLLYPPVPQGTPQQATPGLKDSPTARVRLLRNTLDLPSDENDGVQLFDLPLAYSPVRWQDSPVVSGAFSYYTVFVFDGTLWQRAGDLIALAPNNFQYSQRLWELTPQVYHNWDYNFSDPTSTNPIVNQGPLQRFYGLMGLQFDLIRTELETLLEANDPKKCSGGLLPLLSNQLGLAYEPQMGMYLNRRLISNAIYHYKVKGTEPGVEGIVADASGWSSIISPGYNMVLDQNNAAHVQSTGLWTLNVSAGTPTLALATIPVGGGPSNSPVLGGPTTMMVGSSSSALTAGGGVWTMFFSSGDSTKAILQGVPLRQGATSIPFVVISRYVYPQNPHAFGIAVNFYNAAGNQVGSTLTPAALTSTPAGQWTRVYGSFIVPPTACYLIYYLYSTESFVANGKVWTTMGQVEMANQNLLPIADAAPGPTNGLGAWTGHAGAAVSTTTAPDGSEALDINSPQSGWAEDDATHIPVNPGEFLTVTGDIWAMTNARSYTIGVQYFNAAGASVEFQDAMNAVDVVGQWKTYRGVVGPVPADAFTANLYIEDAAGTHTTEHHLARKVGLFYGNVTTPWAPGVGIPQVWQNARDTRVDVRPDRINYVINPNFESGTGSWTPTLNCGISQSSVPGSLNRFPVLRQKATAFSTGTQQITVAIPAGIANGDLILLQLTVHGNTILTAPFGWNVAISNKTGSTNADLQEIVYWKFANNEPATYNWFSSNVTPVTSQILSFYNTDTVSPIVSASSETGSGTTVSVPSQPISSSIPAGTQVVFISTNPSTVIFPLGSETQQTSVSAGTLQSSDSSTLNITGPTTIPAANASLANGRLWLGQNIIIKGSTIPSAPASYTGNFSLEVISSGAGAMSVTSSAMPVVPGLFYAGSGYLISQSISEPIQMTMNWLDGTNTLISSTSSVIGQENTLGGQWERLGLAEVAPSNAATATLTFKWGLTLGSGEAHYLDAVLFEQAPSVRSYFDGSTPLNGAAFAPPVSADYLWQLNSSGVPQTNNGPSFYYKRRTQKNFRLTTLLPSYLPAGGTFTLLYGLPT